MLLLKERKRNEIYFEEMVQSLVTRRAELQYHIEKELEYRQEELQDIVKENPEDILYPSVLDMEPLNDMVEELKEVERQLRKVNNSDTTRIIEVYRDQGFWYANFRNNKELKNLFGTTKIETSYPEEVRVEVVIKNLQEKNPGSFIVRGTDTDY